MARKKPSNDEAKNKELEAESKVEEKSTETKEDKKEGGTTPQKMDYKTKLQRIKDSLAKQPKVKIIIPKEKSESNGAYETVQINGYLIQIKKGVYVEVPEQVAQIIMDSQQQTEEALQEAARKLAADERMEFDNSN